MIQARAWGLGVLRGASQIYFQTNALTALAVFGAFCIGDLRMAFLALVGAVGGVLGGRLSGYSMDNLSQGLQGFCGALVGAAVFAAAAPEGLGPGLGTAGLALTGGLATGPVTRVIDRAFAARGLRRFGLPATTAPFVLVATAIVMLMPRSLVAAQAAPAAGVAPTATAAESARLLFRSLLANVSQVILVNSAWAGLLILAGLTLAGWRIGLAALLGSAVGTLSALALGQPLAAIGDGMVGYSGVLTALALAVTFLRRGRASWLYALPWVIVTAAVTVAMGHVMSHVYTWPYILTTWVAIVAAHQAGRLPGGPGRWAARLTSSC